MQLKLEGPTIERRQFDSLHLQAAPIIFLCLYRTKLVFFYIHFSDMVN